MSNDPAATSRWGDPAKNEEENDPPRDPLANRLLAPSFYQFQVKEIWPQQPVGFEVNCRLMQIMDSTGGIARGIVFSTLGDACTSLRLSISLESASDGYRTQMKSDRISLSSYKFRCLPHPKTVSSDQADIMRGWSRRFWLHSRSLGCPIGSSSQSEPIRPRVYVIAGRGIVSTGSPLPILSDCTPLSRGEGSMETSQIGDRIQAHFTKRFTDGSSSSSRLRGDKPLEMIVGTAHPRLPGVGTRLEGMSVGDTVTINVSPQEAYGMPDPARIFRVDRARFLANEKLEVGKRMLMQLKGGRTRRVRILEIHERIVVIDTNHPRCGQSVVLDVELVAILPQSSGNRTSGSKTSANRSSEV
jgi:FKBP-type peptidyl-prolyl cis-trans isomerase 2